MQIHLGTSKSLILKCPEELVRPLLKCFTYTNSSISYQLHKHNVGKYRFLQATMRTNKNCMSMTDAEVIWMKESKRLLKLVKPCLLKRASDGMIMFPTGLLNKVKQFFTTNSYPLKGVIVDKRVKPKLKPGFPVIKKIAILRPYQKVALVESLRAEQGTIVSACGTGKTVIIQELIRKLGLKTVVVVPNLSILKQTEKRFTSYFGKGRVGSFSGTQKKIKAITVACAASLAKSDPGIWKGTDVLMLDECHHSPCDTIEKIVYEIFPNAHYRYGFTATNMRTDGANLAIEAAVFPPIFNYSVEDGVREGFLAEPRFLMFGVPFNSYRSYNGKMPVFAYKHHMIYNELLNLKVIDHVNSFLKQGKQVLVLVREKTHGHILQAGIPGSTFVRTKGDESKLKLKSVAPFVKADKAVTDFNKKKLRCLIGTSIIGEGTDIVPVDVLFNLMGGTSKVSVMQNIGRALRISPGKDKVWIIDYIHQTNEMLEKHSIKRHEIYKKLGKIDILPLTK